MSIHRKFAQDTQVWGGHPPTNNKPPGCRCISVYTALIQSTQHHWIHERHHMERVPSSVCMYGHPGQDRRSTAAPVARAAGTLLLVGMVALRLHESM